MRRIVVLFIILFVGWGVATAVFAQMTTRADASKQPITLTIDSDKLQAMGESTYFPTGGATPGNDSCTTATELFFSGSPIGGTTTVTDMTQAVDDPVLDCVWGTPQDSRGYRSVWYKFVATENGVVTVDTVSSNYDTVVGIYTGLCGALTPIACNDDFSGLSSRVTFNIREAETYYIEIADWDASGAGQKTLNAFMQEEPIDSQWELRSTQQTPARTAAAVASYGSALYQFGGQDSAGDISIGINKYETSNNSWTTLTSVLPEYKRYFSAARVGTRIYLPGGDTAVNNQQSALTNNQYAFDLGTGFMVPDALANFPTPLAWSQSVAVPGDNGYYVVGGLGDKWDAYPTVTISTTTTAYNTVWRYDVGGDSWGVSGSTMLTSRFGHTAVYLNGQICVMGGLNSNLEMLVSGECWTPPNGASSFIPSTTIPRYGAGSAVSPDGRWFIFGGLDSQQKAVSEVEVWDPNSASWNILDVSYDLGGTLSNSPRARPQGEFIGYNLYALGGSNTDSNSDPTVNFNVERLFSVGGNSNYLPLVLNNSNSIFDDNFSVARPLVANVLQNGRFYLSTDFYSTYYFDVSSIGLHTINLTGIPGSSNYDLYLYDDNKNIWGQSQNGGNQNETVQLMLSPGRYYVQVQRIFGDFNSSNFQLIVNR